jgi:competence protein ComGC
VGGYGRVMKNSKQTFKGFVLFETLISLLIITLLTTPVLSWILNIEKLMEKEHQKLVEAHNARKSLLLKTDIGQAKLVKNAQDKIIGVRFIDKEVKLLE